MLNSNIAAELERVQKGMLPKIDQWQITFNALGSAEEKALANVRKARPPVWDPDLREAALQTVEVAGFPAVDMEQYFTSPLNRGLRLIWEMLWKTLRRKPDTQEPAVVIETDTTSFLTVKSFFGGALRQVARELGRFANYIGKLPSGLSFHDAEHAMLLMLNSIVFYPPKAPPKADELAVRLEWNYWRHVVLLMQREVRVIRSDKYLSLPNLDGMFQRMKETGWNDLVDFSQDDGDVYDDLFKFVTEKSKMMIAIDLRFPPPIIGFIDEGKRLSPHWREFLNKERANWTDAGV